MDTPASNKPTLQRLSDQSVHVLDETTIIGRHEDCHLVLKSERGASRKHARITVENNAAVLLDLGSLNGTMVNGREISRAVQLSDGDIVVFDEQEYRFAGPATQPGTSGDNVTVIANKDEIGKPESIKPAIRVVDVEPPVLTTSDKPAESGAFDDTEAWPVEDNVAQQDENAYGQTAIPATSRPGGDAPTPKRLQDKSSLHSDEFKPKPRFMSWVAIVPLLILFLLIAFYFAYKAGFSAGSL